MTDPQAAVEELLAERPEVEETLRRLCDLDENRESWDFDEANVGSGLFGELVSRGIVEHTADDGYELANRPAVRAALDGEQLASGDESQLPRFDVPLPSTSRRTLGFLTIALVFMAVLRSLTWPAVFRGDAVVLTGNDPYFYRYWVEQLLAGPASPWEFGSVPQSIRVHDVGYVVTMWAVAAAIGGGPDTSGAVLAVYPVVSAVVTGILVYWMATHVFADRRAGLSAVALLAVTPVHGFRASLGFGDHHAFDFLLLTVTLAAIVAACDHREPKVRGYLVAIIGVSTAWQLLSWRGAPLVIAPVGGVVVLLAASREYERRMQETATTVTAGLVVATLAAAAFVLGFDWASRFRLLTLASVATITVLGVTTARVLRDYDRRSEAVLAVTVGTAVLLAVAAAVILPESTRVALGGLFGGTAAVEGVGILDQRFGFLVAPIIFFGFVLFLGLPYATVFGWRGWRGGNGAELSLGAYAWYFFVLSLLQVRFAGELSVPLAVVSGAGFVHLASRVELADTLREVSEPTLPDRRTIGLLAVLFLLVGGLGLIQTPIKQNQLTYSESEYATALAIDGHAVAGESAYPENYVFSPWSQNRMYNYFVNGQARTYAYALENYQPFISSPASGRWYERLRDRAGYVITTEISNPGAETTQALLHERLGSGTPEVSGSGHYRAVYVADGGEKKAFELVPGGVVTGSAKANETIRVSASVEVDGRTFTYRRFVRTTAAGNWVVRVPYAASYRANGTDVEVSESAVQSGSFTRERTSRARWQFDDTRGSIAFDSLGNNHGRIEGATWADGVSGKALAFDGDDQVVVAETSRETLAADDGFTVSTWFRTNGSVDFRNESRYPAIVSKSPFSNYGSIDGYQIGLNRGSIQGIVGDGEATTLVGPRVTDGEWHRATLTWNGSHAVLYLDGQRVDAAPFDGRPTNDHPLSIGSFAASGNHFSGRIDETRFFDRGLTPEEVEESYEQQDD